MKEKQPLPKCSDCAHARLKTPASYYTCKKNCVQRTLISDCMMPKWFEKKEPVLTKEITISVENYDDLIDIWKNMNTINRTNTIDDVVGELISWWLRGDER